MQEVALPRTVDAVVVTLQGAGMFERAAEALGCTETIPFDLATIVPRASTLDDLADELCGVIGADRCKQPRAQGAEIEPRDVLCPAQGWLAE